MLEFTDAEFMTAKEKEAVLKAWKMFVDSDFSRNNFAKSLYNHLHLHCGFIAHYNIHGFYDNYFPIGNPELETFLGHFDRNHRYFNHPWGDYADLKKAMNDSLEPKLKKLRNSSFEIIKKEELAVAQTILSKYGIKSATAGQA